MDQGWLILGDNTSPTHRRPWRTWPAFRGLLGWADNNRTLVSELSPLALSMTCPTRARRDKRQVSKFPRTTSFLMHNTLRYDRKRQMSDAEAQLLVNEVFSGYSALLGDHTALLWLPVGFGLKHLTPMPMQVRANQWSKFHQRCQQLTMVQRFIDDELCEACNHLPKSLLAEISMLPTTAVLLHATSGNQTLPCRQSQPEPSRPLPLTAIIGRTGHFIDALIFRQAGGDETYGGEGGCDVKDVMDFQPNEYLTKVTQEWKWRDGVRWEGTCV